MPNLSMHLLAAIAIISVSSPVFAHGNGHGNGHGHGHGHGYSKQYRKYVKHQSKRSRKMARWQWSNHNWSQRRDYLRSNWRDRSAQISANQRAQLDAQLRAQWLAYHNNNWNGGYEWNQYSDPAFLDYVYNRKPSLLETIRRLFGIL